MGTIVIIPRASYYCISLVADLTSETTVALSILLIYGARCRNERRADPASGGPSGARNRSRQGTLFVPLGGQPGTHRRRGLDAGPVNHLRGLLPMAN